MAERTIDKTYQTQNGNVTVAIVDPSTVNYMTSVEGYDHPMGGSLKNPITQKQGEMIRYIKHWLNVDYTGPNSSNSAYRFINKYYNAARQSASAWK